MKRRSTPLAHLIVLIAFCGAACGDLWALCRQECGKSSSYTKADGTYVIIEPSCIEICDLSQYEKELLKGLQRQKGGDGGDGGGGGGGGGRLKLKGRILEDQMGKKVCQMPPIEQHRIPPGTKVIKYSLRSNGTDTFPGALDAGFKEMEGVLKGLGSSITFQRVDNGQFLTVGWNDGTAKGAFGVKPEALMQTSPIPSRGTITRAIIALKTHTNTGIELASADANDIRRSVFHELMHLFGVGHIVNQDDPKNDEPVNDNNKDLGQPSAMRQKTPGEEEASPCDSLALKSVLP